MTRPFFLITNDDGIQALGIKHLWQAAADLADVAISAPHTEKSGSGLATTWSKPLQIREAPWEGKSPAWSINGTPADCVKMGLSVLFPGRRPDLILSGVNRGSNAGRTIFYSGTVGGVIEGALRGIPGIAFSFSDSEFPALGSVKSVLTPLIDYFLTHGMPPGTFINVTLPPRCEQGVRGFRMALQGQSYCLENPDRRIHPDGVPYYWLGSRWSDHTEDHESDVALVRKGYVAVTPIHIGDLTDRDQVEKHGESIQRIYAKNEV